MKSPTLKIDKGNREINKGLLYNKYVFGLFMSPSIAKVVN